ncbi:pilin [Patescibacteria group bacterium]
MLLSINSFVFAQTSTTYEECVSNFKKLPGTYATCEKLTADAKKCVTDSETKCEDKYKSFNDRCDKEATSGFEDACSSAVEDLKNKCVEEEKRTICKALEDKATLCTEDANKNIESICRTQFPEKLKESTTTTDKSRIPSVPNIDTLVRPNVEDVSKVNPYLSTTFLPRVAKTVVSFGIGAAVIGLIMGSIGMLTAYGNDEKYGNAKKAVMFSIIGLIICLLSFAIVQLIFFTGFQAGQIK